MLYTPLFLKCDCQSHSIEIERYRDDENEQGFYITVWNSSRNGKKIIGIKEKLRWCWMILTTGNPWADDVMLSNEKAIQLSEYINQNVQK